MTSVRMVGSEGGGDGGALFACVLQPLVSRSDGSAGALSPSPLFTGNESARICAEALAEVSVWVRGRLQQRMK